MCPGPLLASVDTVWVIVLFAFYVVPTLIALTRRTTLLVMVFALNLFLGWTIVGWAVSLALAMLLPPVRAAGAGVVPSPAVAPAATVTPVPAPPAVGVNPAEPPAALEFLLSPARVAALSVLAPVFYHLWWFWRFFRFAEEERFPRARSFWCIFFPFYGWAVIGRLFHDLEDRLRSNRAADFNAQVAVALVVAGDVGAGWAARLPILLALFALGLSVVCTAVALYQVQTAANAYLCTKYPGGQGAGLIPAELFAAMAGLLLVSLLVLEAVPNLSDLAASTSRATATVSPRPSSFQFPTGFRRPFPPAVRPLRLDPRTAAAS